jgi:hypothetical protein
LQSDACCGHYAPYQIKFELSADLQVHSTMVPILIIMMEAACGIHTPSNETPVGNVCGERDCAGQTAITEAAKRALLSVLFYLWHP